MFNNQIRPPFVKLKTSSLSKLLVCKTKVPYFSLLWVQCLSGSTPAILCLLLLHFSAFACGQELATKTFTYKKTAQGDLGMKEYLPSDWKVEDKRPAVVFFFGGGWTGGTPTQFEPQAKHFAVRGMVAFCADYRVKSRHGVSPAACVEDAKSAIRWVRQNAGELGVDPDKIIGSGGSAGGHIAACTGLCPGLDSNKEVQAISSRPNALILFNPVLNFQTPELTNRIDNNEKLAKAISPTLHLVQDSPPTLLFFGKADHLLVQGEEFMKKSKQLGHHAEIILADGVGHGFFNKAPWQERTTKRADEFLVLLGYLKAQQ